MQSKKIISAFIGTSLSLSTLSLNSAESAKTNIIYFNADDLGVMDVKFMGRQEYNTPNLDKLASEGMVFTQAYAPAANCAPSRACCMSGQYGPRHGVYTVGSSERGKIKDRKIIPIKNMTYLSENNITLAEALKAGGYKTIHLGKWHLGKNPKSQGFDVNIGGSQKGGPQGGYFSPFTQDVMKPYNKEYPKGTHRTDIFADQAIKFIKSNKDNAFFMYMSYYSVHTRLEPVPGMVEKYRKYKKEKKIKNFRPGYASMIEKMDESIGKIVNMIDKLGLKENTLILFTSDNGGIRSISKQDPYRAGKGSYYEGGIREPLLVRWPAKVKAGSKCDVPVCGIDFYPTFLEATGISKPENKILDGLSLMPLLTQSGKLKERTLYWHFPIYLQAYNPKVDDGRDPLFRTRPGSALRDGKWKLHEYFEDMELELYNLEEDIGERKNLASTMPDKVAELKEKLYKWRKSMNAPVPQKLNPKYEEKQH